MSVTTSPVSSFGTVSQIDAGVLNVGYVDAIIAAGGLPLVLPPLRKENLADIDALLDQCTGIILTGGADMDPRRNGQALTAAVSPMPARRSDARSDLSRRHRREARPDRVGLAAEYKAVVCEWRPVQAEHIGVDPAAARLLHHPVAKHIGKGGERRLAVGDEPVGERFIRADRARVRATHPGRQLDMLIIAEQAQAHGAECRPG